MWGNAKDGWYENNRHNLGTLKVPCDERGDFTEKDILNAMKRRVVRPLFGPTYHALNTRDRSVVFIEEASDGWYEIGLVRGRKPVYGLRLKEETA